MSRNAIPLRPTVTSIMSGVSAMREHAAETHGHVSHFDPRTRPTVTAMMSAVFTMSAAPDVSNLGRVSILDPSCPILCSRPTVMMKTTRPTTTRRRHLQFIPGKRTTLQQRKRRPLVFNQSMHVVMRSSKARGKMSLLRNETKLARFCQKMAKNHGVRIYKLANVGNHIHIHLRVTRAIKWKGFISGLAGGIASSLGYRREMTVGPGVKGFWDSRPYSAPVSPGFGFRTVQAYLELNILEASGVIPSRKHWRPNTNWRDVVKIFARWSSTEVSRM